MSKQPLTITEEGTSLPVVKLFNKRVNTLPKIKVPMVSNIFMAIMLMCHIKNH